MTHNDLKKGDKVLCRGGRLGTIMDNRTGICRCVKIQERDGWYGEMGDVYVWEIQARLAPETDLATVTALHQEGLEMIELSPAHAKKQRAIEGALIKLRYQE